MISVITACFNCEKTISKAIYSLLNQTDCDFEHIVIDGNSSDKTLSIINCFADEYEKRGVKLTVLSESDHGMYDAINKGIHLSKGEIIGILNSDDTYENNTIEVVKEAFLIDTKVDIVMGASNTINGKKISVKKAGEGKFITSRNFNHGSMFVKRLCYFDVGLYENDGNYYDDFMWYIKALKKQKRFKIIGNVLYNFYCGGMSTKKALPEVFRRIGFRYKAYRKNGCSRFYIFECILMEFIKWIAVKQ